MKRFCTLLVAALLSCAAVSESSAQTASHSGLVLGVETGSLGVACLYQLDANLQVGSGVGLGVGDMTWFYLSPQVRYLQDIGIADIKFVAEAQFRLQFGDQEDTELRVRALAQKWITDHVAIYGGVSVLALNLDPSDLSVGILSPNLGIQIRL